MGINRRSKQLFKSKRFWSRFFWAADVFYVHSISFTREIASVDEICDYMRIVLISICEIQHVGSNCCLICFSIKMLLACAGPRRQRRTLYNWGREQVTSPMARGQAAYLWLIENKSFSRCFLSEYLILKFENIATQLLM